MMPAGSRTRFNEAYFICNTYFDIKYIILATKLGFIDTV